MATLVLLDCPFHSSTPFVHASRPVTDLPQTAWTPIAPPFSREHGPAGGLHAQRTQSCSSVIGAKNGDPRHLHTGTEHGPEPRGQRPSSVSCEQAVMGSEAGQGVLHGSLDHSGRLALTLALTPPPPVPHTHNTHHPSSFTLIVSFPHSFPSFSFQHCSPPVVLTQY